MSKQMKMKTTKKRKKLIRSCSDCSFLEVEKVHTADSFENVHKWNCKLKNKKISGYVDTFDIIEIPEWCLLREIKSMKVVE